jgi:hypothetical protein
MRLEFDVRRLFFGLFARRTLHTAATGGVSLQRSAQQPLACKRSSIRSRSTSQNLSDDRRSLSICSASLSFIVSGCDVPERLLNFRGLRLNFNVRHLARFGLIASINHSPLVSLSLLMCSHQNAVMVVPKSFGSSSAGSAGRLETSA